MLHADGHVTANELGYTAGAFYLLYDICNEVKKRKNGGKLPVRHLHMTVREKAKPPTKKPNES